MFFLVNLVLLPLYGAILSEQQRVTTLPIETFGNCTQWDVNTWGIWATATILCTEHGESIRLVYPPKPQLLNPHDLFKVRKWIEQVKELQEHGRLLVFVDHRKREAFTNGFETGGWGELLFLLLLFDAVAILLLCYLWYTDDPLDDTQQQKRPPHSFMVFPSDRRRFEKRSSTNWDSVYSI
jgi:hypothetical protein